ncbi:MAG TPA: tyrosine-type recombinase/integrase [Flavisolibacter sp.]|nr:tyrosine-type recombinase/integrase [Flavisolibacter sp.]
MFSVFTGLAYKDAITLKGSNREERGDNVIKLCIKRSKTDIQTESFLVSQAITIVERYKQLAESQITGLVLPKRSNEKLNVQLKILAEMVNIPINLSSHIARHTHRQQLAEAGIEDMGVIKRMMGHSRSGDIDNVYYSITEPRLSEAKDKFEAYLNKHLIK